MLVIDSGLDGLDATVSYCDDCDDVTVHLSADERSATIDAFRAAIAGAVVLCLADSLIAAKELRREDR